MILKSFKALLASVVLLSLSSVARAGQPFDATVFQQSQAAGKSILIDVSASWCPTCKQQRPIIQGLEKSLPNLVVFDVDFDSAKDALKSFRVQTQSTLIVFKGSNEVGRSTGETDPEKIKALVSKAL